MGLASRNGGYIKTQAPFISLIAGLIFMGLRRGWAMSGWQWRSPHQVAAFVSWTAGLIYGGLAGFSIPTLRAVIMLSVVMSALLWQRHHTATQILNTSLRIVLLLDPMSVLQNGFWLSFLAVALLIHSSCLRLGSIIGWRHTMTSQLAGSLGLSPLLIDYFQQCSLVAPLANAIAIPLLGSLIVPLALLAVVLLYLSPSMAEPLLWLSAQLLQGLEWWLQRLAEWPFATLELPPPSFYTLLLAGIAVLLITGPRGLPGRQLAPCFLIPLLINSSTRPCPGELRLTLLDVGLGLATFFETADHSLIFDTGSRLPDGLDMGAAVIQPFLRHQALRDIDHLVISHGDNDHSGGAAHLIANLTINHISSSDPRWAELPRGSYCHSDQHWQWDGVDFRFLAPPATAFTKENDNSCVLMMTTDSQQLLLTGDIEAAAEHWLVEHYADKLHSQVMVAPHHGSKTSSSAELLQHVRPEWILIAAGYLNRFHFPHPDVIQRYRQYQMQWLNTADEGAIQIMTSGKQLLLSRERQRQQRYWRFSAEDNRRVKP